MASPLDGIASQIFGAFKDIFRDAVLVRASFTGASPDIAFDPPAPTETEYPCKALVTKYSAMLRAEGVVDANDRKVLILANSLDTGIVPAAQNRVTIRGITFTIQEVETDPALAVWTCRGRL